MSTLNQFIGGGLKSIQSGSFSISAGSPITISSVNTAKSIVILRGMSNTNGYIMVSLSLSSATQLAYTTTGTASVGTANWTVAEFF